MAEAVCDQDVTAKNLPSNRENGHSGSPICILLPNLSVEKQTNKKTHLCLFGLL